MATMLEIVQDFCGTLNLPEPATVFGTTDPQVQQAMRILEREGNDLAQRGRWEALTFEASHTTVATEDQGAITSIATNGFRSIVNETIWDRTNQLPVFGPMAPDEWQTVKALASTGPRYRFRIRGGRLLANPTPTAGCSWYFEYLSKNWIVAVDGTTYKRRFTADTDTVLLPDDLSLQGLLWRWKKEKGMDYAEDFRTYEEQVKTALGRDGGKARLRMDGARGGPMPGIFVTPYSWPL